MTLGLLCPKMAGELNELAGIPLEKFSNTQSVRHYLEALVNSGVAAEEERGVIYVMGNTSVGKTSLVNTFKNYIENVLHESPLDLSSSLISGSGSGSLVSDSSISLSPKSEACSTSEVVKVKASSFAKIADFLIVFFCGFYVTYMFFFELLLYTGWHTYCVKYPNFFFHAPFTLHLAI